MQPVLDVQLEEIKEDEEQQSGELPETAARRIYNESRESELPEVASELITENPIESDTEIPSEVAKTETE